MMKSAFIKYLRQLLIFSGIIAGIALIFTFILPKNYISPALPFLLVFFLATSLLSFYYLLQSTSKRFIKFVNTFLLSIIIKLFLFTAVIIAYVLLNRSDAIPFMMGFFILYLCFTIFEATSIIKYTHPSNQDNQVH